MPTSTEAPYRARRLAESFGADPARYDRTRPGYPRPLFDALLDDLPGLDALDVGIGTGISARPLRAAGCRVLGVEVDPEMAAHARRDGFDVELGRFEDWNAAGRRFDLVAAGMTWHWVDPDRGTERAAEVLRPRGRLAAFWNVMCLPPALVDAFAEVYTQTAPELVRIAPPADGLAAYEPILARTAQAIDTAPGLSPPERHRFDWERRYTTDEWRELVPTFGGHGRLDPARLDRLIAGIAAVVDDAGGAFTCRYTAVAVSARRR